MQDAGLPIWSNLGLKQTLTCGQEEQSMEPSMNNAQPANESHYQFTNLLFSGVLGDVLAFLHGGQFPKAVVAVFLRSF